MTMHKAKGLQFDASSCPASAAGVAAHRTNSCAGGGERGLLIAPSPSPGSDPDPVFDYLKRLEKEESDAELGRLLYVACTRAKSRLHLIGAPPSGETKGVVDGSRHPRRRWPSSGPCSRPRRRPRRRGGRWRAASGRAAARTAAARLPAAERRRRARTARDIQRHHPGDIAVRAGSRTHPRRGHARAPAARADGGRAVGRSAARHARVARAGGPRECRLRRRRDRTVRATRAGRRAPHPRRHAWPLALRPVHAEARSEWAIAGVEAGAIVHIVVDRTFVADGVRWIVDFKTGAPRGR